MTTKVKGLKGDGGNMIKRTGLMIIAAVLGLSTRPLQKPD